MQVRKAERGADGKRALVVEVPVTGSAKAARAQAIAEAEWCPERNIPGRAFNGVAPSCSCGRSGLRALSESHGQFPMVRVRRHKREATR